MKNDKIRIVKRIKSDWWRAVKIKDKWVQVKTAVYVGNDVSYRLFAVELENGKYMSKEDFNKHDCIEGNETSGFKVWTPSF